MLKTSLKQTNKTVAELRDIQAAYEGPTKLQVLKKLRAIYKIMWVCQPITLLKNNWGQRLESYFSSESSHKPVRTCQCDFEIVPGSPVFPLSSKTNISKFQLDLESEGHRFVSRNRLLSVTLVKQSWLIGKVEMGFGHVTQPKKYGRSGAPKIPLWDHEIWFGYSTHNSITI